MSQHTLRVGMVGVGMIFDETYRPLFESLRQCPLYGRDTGAVEVALDGVASRTGTRTEALRQRWQGHFPLPANHAGPTALESLLASPVDCVCVATPDDRHFAAARESLRRRKHVLIEKPSVLTLAELDSLSQEAAANGVLCKVVYHKLFDPDHKKLRTHVVTGTLRHVNNGYCTLLEPKSVSGSQFAEWITGRNPGTYVAVHYLKLIDFTFGPAWQLTRISATGQRGLVGPPLGDTWDSVQLQVTYTHPDAREATFDIHTNWVTPDNFPGYVEQEVQFRFDNGIWLAHQRKRGVEMAIEGRTPTDLKNTPNHHYNGTFVEPWGGHSQRGYGLEAIRRFFEEVAHVEFGGPAEGRPARLASAQAFTHNDISADRNCVAIVQAMEAILADQAAGRPGTLAEVNGPDGGLVLLPRRGEPTVLYAPPV